MAKKNFDDIGLNEQRRVTCGRIFFPAPLHVYKRNYGCVGRTKWFCKYTCMTAWDREHPHRHNIAGKKRTQGG